MADKLGIVELQNVIALGLSLGELVDSLSDGVGLGDIGALLKCAKRVSPALSAIRSGLLLPELKDLSDDEKASLKAYVEQNFDLKDDALEMGVKKGLDVVIDLAEILKVFP